MPTIPSTNDLLLTVVQQANDLRILGELVEELRARNAELEAAAPDPQPSNPLPRQQRRASTRSRKG